MLKHNLHGLLPLHPLFRLRHVSQFFFVRAERRAVEALRFDINLVLTLYFVSCILILFRYPIL